MIDDFERVEKTISDIRYFSTLAKILETSNLRQIEKGRHDRRTKYRFQPSSQVALVHLQCSNKTLSAIDLLFSSSHVAKSASSIIYGYQ
jgi:hypothetical protein